MPILYDSMIHRLDLFMAVFIDFLNYLLMRERNTDSLFHSFMHSLVDSHMCPDWESNLQP